LSTMFGAKTCALLTALVALGTTQAVQAGTITVKNNCSYQIAIGMYPPVYNSGGAFLGAGATISFAAWASGTGGRLWSRHNCVAGPQGFDICSSGTCGGTGISCNGTTAAGVTEAEINFNAGGADWYDISYVDGYNDMANITPSVGFAPTATSKPACATVLNDGYNGVYVANGDSCQSPCNAANQGVVPYNSNTDRWCCHNAYGTSATCNEGSWPAPESTYVNTLHSVTNGEYTYAYDDNIGLHQTTANSSYTITFCPSTSGSASSSSSSSSGGGVPAPPSGLTATAGNAQVVLSWTAAVGANTYNIYRGTAAGAESGTAIATNVGSTTYTNTGLTNGTHYYYKVAGVNSYGTGTMSNEANATPAAGGVPAWVAGHAYAIGNDVMYGSTEYHCLQAHTSEVGWEPPNAPALWGVGP